MNNSLKLLCSAVIFLLTASFSNAQSTYCNPLNIPYRYAMPDNNPDGSTFREAADPTMVVYDNEYYLFASKCGVYYNSKDMVHWTPIATSDLPLEGYAPAVAVLDGTFYYTYSGGTTRIWRTKDPKSGHWELVEGGGLPTNDGDPALFVDDGRLFLFYGCSDKPLVGIRGVELDTETLKPKGNPVLLAIGRPYEFGWDTFGEYNTVDNHNPWIEGPWVTKHDGKYYLQYATPGTELKSYSDAVYVSDSPLGPYFIQSFNPFSYRPEGFIAGAGHGSTFQDLKGNWWHIATGTISSRAMFERRLVMFPVYFDEDGIMYCQTSYGDFPYYISREGKDSPGWMLLSYGKPAASSSSMAGHPAEYAVNEDIRTWWSASTGNKGEYFQVDLGKPCHVNAVQINIADEGSTLRNDRTAADRYVVSVSQNGKKWKKIIDRSESNVCASHEYVELDEPVEARYVKVTNVFCPSGCFSLYGLRVFGSAEGALPGKPALTSVSRLSKDLRKVELKWDKAEGAIGYTIRYGTAKDKLYASYQVFDTDSLTINNLNVHQPYYFTIEAFNESGITRSGQVVSSKVVLP